MKKFLSILLTATLLFSLCGLTAAAADSAAVYVTIADSTGKLALVQEKITVTDIDADGALTINDALACAHDAKFEGGAAAGYCSATGDYGLSMTKLWGVENGGSYGYYLNNASAWSLTDPVKDGDFLNAFVYTDLTAWSDTYCFFDANTAAATAGDTVELTLSAAGYDAEYKPITVPVEGAVITVNGAATEYKTDAQGKVTVKLDTAGEAVISAVSDAKTLVPPVCVATVSAAAEVPTETPSVDVPETNVPDEEVPATGSNEGFVLLLCLLSGAALTVLFIKDRKQKN